MQKKAPEIKTYFDCISSHRTVRLPGTYAGHVTWASSHVTVGHAI